MVTGVRLSVVSEQLNMVTNRGRAEAERGIIRKRSAVL